MSRRTVDDALPVDLSRVEQTLAAYSREVQHDALGAIGRIRDRVRERLIYASSDTCLDVIEREDVFTIHYLAFSDCIVILKLSTETAPPVVKWEAFLLFRGTRLMGIPTKGPEDGPACIAISSSEQGKGAAPSTPAARHDAIGTARLRCRIDATAGNRAKAVMSLGATGKGGGGGTITCGSGSGIVPLAGLSAAPMVCADEVTGGINPWAMMADMKGSAAARPDAG